MLPVLSFKYALVDISWLFLAKSDYINTSLHTHYDTDFPELTSKLEKFSLGGPDNTAALF
jgi:hypothetical protein